MASPPPAQAGPLAIAIPAVLTSAGTVAAFGAITMPPMRSMDSWTGLRIFRARHGRGSRRSSLRPCTGRRWQVLACSGALVAPLLVPMRMSPTLGPSSYCRRRRRFAYALGTAATLALARAPRSGGRLFMGFAFVIGHTVVYGESGDPSSVSKHHGDIFLFAFIGSGAGIAASRVRRRIHFALFVPSVSLPPRARRFAFRGPCSGSSERAGSRAPARTIVILASWQGLGAEPRPVPPACRRPCFWRRVPLVWPAAANLPLFPSVPWLQSWPHPKSDFDLRDLCSDRRCGPRTFLRQTSARRAFPAPADCDDLCGRGRSHSACSSGHRLHALGA